jgi:hypothetical protein
MVERDWQTDWQQFVVLMAQLYASGSLDSEVSDKYRGQRVSWRGTVAEVKVAAKYDAPGIVMQMPATPVRISGNRRFVGAHLFLPLEDRNVTVRAGDVIGFDATISLDSILGPIDFVEAHQQHKVYLQTSLDDVVLRLV